MKNKIEYTEEDIKLLATPFPESPCVRCGMPICTGCQKIIAHEAIFKRYRECGILEVALEIDKIRVLQSQIDRFLKDVETKKSEIFNKYSIDANEFIQHLRELNGRLLCNDSQRGTLKILQKMLEAAKEREGLV